MKYYWCFPIKPWKSSDTIILLFVLWITSLAQDVWRRPNFPTAFLTLSLPCEETLFPLFSLCSLYMSFRNSPRLQCRWFSTSRSVSCSVWQSTWSTHTSSIRPTPPQTLLREWRYCTLCNILDLSCANDFYEIYLSSYPVAIKCEWLCVICCWQCVAAFAVSAVASQWERTGKPFNPLLGETYELVR